MSDLETTAIVIGIIVGIIAIITAIYKVFRWFYPKKETKHETHPAPKVKKPTRNKSDDITATASGQGNVVIGKAGDVHIKPSNSEMRMPYEDFQRRIELERNDAVEKYKKASNDEKPLSLMKVTEFDNKLADLPKYYQEAQELISNSMSMLISIFDGKTLYSKANAERFMEAVDAIEGNDLSKADECLADMETYKGLNTSEIGNLIFIRGDIAEHEIRWQDAAKHYARAAQLDPCFRNLIFAQKLADNIGDYDSALSLGMKAQKVAIADYGEGTEEHALALNNLGGLYEVQGQAKEAKPFYEQALNIYKKTSGETHHETASSLNNLAKCYDDLGQTEEAEQLYLQSIEISKKDVGENRSPTASAINNLALLYLDQGLYKKAELLCKEALEIRQKSLHKNHPSIANGLNALAGIYEEQKRYEEADNFYLQALKIVETTLGPDHPHTKLVKENYERNKKLLANTQKTTPK